jgi:hypothetical protein
MNTFMNAVTAPYGLQIQDFGDILQAETGVTEANISAAGQASAAAAQQPGQVLEGSAAIAAAFAIS